MGMQLRNRAITASVFLLCAFALALFGMGQSPSGGYQSPSSGASSTFPTLAGGTNTTSAFVCGTGCSIATSGTGTNVATSSAPCGSTTQVQYNNAGACGANASLTFNGSNTLAVGANSGTAIVNIGNGGQNIASNFAVSGTLFASGAWSATSYLSATNCNSTASPAVCGSAAAGMFVLAAAATTVTVNTTAVTANSEIIVFNDDSLGTRLGVTCNTGLDNVLVSARTPATSFTVTGSAPVTNPNCYSYIIIN
jgi:hypothetical protein